MSDNTTPDGRQTLASDHAQPQVTRQYFGRILAELRIAAGFTQGTLGEKVASTRSTIAQWESGRNLPAADTVRALDELLSAGGELVSASRDAREAQRAQPRQPRALPKANQESERRPNILQVFHEVGRALGAKLLRDTGGVGWRHELQNKDKTLKPTPFATAYGLKALLILRESGVSTAYWTPDDVQIDISEIENWLWDAREPFDKDNDTERKGWSGGSFDPDMPPTAQVTAGLLDALHRVNPSFDVDLHIEQLGVLVRKESFAQSRPAAICMVLDACLRMAPNSSLTSDLIKMLLKTQLEIGRWPEKQNEDLVHPKPSVAHTARAIWTLQRASVLIAKSDQPEELSAVIDAGADWLAKQDDLRNVDELADRLDEIPLRHFTAAWVLRALIASGRFDPHGIAGRQALDEIWKAYDPGEHLWVLRNGEVPIWMTFDALESLRLYALVATHAESSPMDVRLAKPA